MPIKKVKHTQDRKEVASKQKWEVAVIAKKFKTTQKAVLEIMLSLGKNGKYCRSRRKIEAELRAINND